MIVSVVLSLYVHVHIPVHTYDDDAMGSTIVTRSDCAESFLPSRVPLRVHTTTLVDTRGGQFCADVHTRANVLCAFMCRAYNLQLDGLAVEFDGSNFL